MMATVVVTVLSMIGTIAVVCFVAWVYMNIREEKERERKRRREFYDSIQRDIGDIQREVLNIRSKLK